MKQSSQTSIKKVLLLALGIRLVLIPLSYHSDLNNNEIWGIYAREFGLRGFYDWLNFGNYARPDYPPLAMVLFNFLRYLWAGIFQVVWKINIALPLFPSNLVTWLDIYGMRALIKVPGIISDLAIGLIIYREAKKISPQKAVYYSKLFLLHKWNLSNR